MNVGIGTLLFLIFLTLKLTHVIAWSWWWVTAPIWGVFVVVVGVIFVAGYAYILAVLKRRKS